MSLDYAAMLRVALDEARQGLEEGGIPIGAALFRADGTLLGAGHNRRVQENDPSVHAENRRLSQSGQTAQLPGYHHGLPPWRRAGTAAVWCASSKSAPWWWGSRGRSRAACSGCVTTGSR